MVDHKNYATNLWKQEHPNCKTREIDGNVYGFIWGYTRDFCTVQYTRAFPIYMEHSVSDEYLKRLYEKHFK